MDFHPYIIPAIVTAIVGPLVVTLAVHLSHAAKRALATLVLSVSGIEDQARIARDDYDKSLVGTVEVLKEKVAVLERWLTVLQGRLDEAENEAHRAHASAKRSQRMFSALHELYVADVGREPILKNITDEAIEAHKHLGEHIETVQTRVHAAKDVVSSLQSQVQSVSIDVSGAANGDS